MEPRYIINLKVLSSLDVLDCTAVDHICHLFIYLFF